MAIGRDEEPARRTRGEGEITRPRTVVTRIVVAVSLCAALLVAVLFLFSGKRPTNILTSTAFVPKQSLPVGSVPVIEKTESDTGMSMKECAQHQPTIPIPVYALAISFLGARITALDNAN